MQSNDQTTGTEEPVLARLQAAPFQRWAGITIQAVLAVLLVYLAFTGNAQPALLRLVILVLGIGGFVTAWLLWQGTQRALELTRSELRDDSGRVLARISDVREVSRGAFAMKPSQGFTLRLHRGGTFVWVPGLWWRMGRRVGIGGVTASQPSRRMADQITLLLTGTEPG
ncbi:hypothetical protein [Pseudorhodobacter sp.]|uniref:hypothetical protein n=1 Tax=Pseudorhodobacter sp. TaxID=1934400 RepID=UPI002647DA85|nr:hypothetical protein [Pseudorhodobacter sp.]MDN5788764.1 hypothetical protein [Pseudorhodobacter sp.]